MNNYPMFLYINFYLKKINKLFIVVELRGRVRENKKKIFKKNIKNNLQ
jgi:hypothetical protein